MMFEDRTLLRAAWPEPVTKEGSRTIAGLTCGGELPSMLQSELFGHEEVLWVDWYDRAGRKFTLCRRQGPEPQWVGEDSTSQMLLDAGDFLPLVDRADVGTWAWLVRDLFVTHGQDVEGATGFYLRLEGTREQPYWYAGCYLTGEKHWCGCGEERLDGRGISAYPWARKDEFLPGLDCFLSDPFPTIPEVALVVFMVVMRTEARERETLLRKIAAQVGEEVASGLRGWSIQSIQGLFTKSGQVRKLPKVTRIGGNK